MDTTSGELPAATKLAAERTGLAHERTLMAWVRTATSLISFGFTIHQFFQYMRDNQPGAAEVQWIGPRGFGLLMIGTGLTALILATVQHRRAITALRAQYGGVVPFSLSALIGSLVGLLGILGLVTVLFRR